MYLILLQTMLPAVPDNILVVLSVILGADKLLSMLGRNKINLPLMLEKIVEISSVVDQLKKDVDEVKDDTHKLDKSHHDTFARNEDGSFKWHNHKYIQDKIKNIEQKMYDFDKKTDDMISIVRSLKDDLGS